MKKSKAKALAAAAMLLFFAVSFGITLSAGIVRKHGMYSGQLEKRVSRDGNIERTEYFYNGKITYAYDKRYASMVRTWDGDTMLEQYFDEKGAPQRQSAKHYALLRVYDAQGRNYKTTYIGANGLAMTNKNGYCMWIRDFDESGHEKTVRYFDTNGKAVKTSFGVYGYRSVYEGDRRVELVYLDKNDMPKKNTSGYAIKKTTYYESGPNEGLTENEFYFSAQGKPAAVSNGTYGVHREYDELGRVNVLTHLAADGSPMETKYGYCTVKQTFSFDNSIKTELFFDKEGKPAELSRGRYGYIVINGKKEYANKYGHFKFELDNFLRNYPVGVVLMGLTAVLLSAALGKKENTALLLLYLVFIVYMTLRSREEWASRAKLELFWSYKQFLSSKALRIEIINNIWLFIPLGSILHKLIEKPWRIALPLLLSIIIEAIQYSTGLGLAEIDDVISNGLGGLIGLCAADMLAPMYRRLRDQLGRVKTEHANKIAPTG